MRRFNSEEQIPCCRNVYEVLFDNPSVPMSLKLGLCYAPILKLSKSPFIDNVCISSAVKQNRSNPRLMGQVNTLSKQGMVSTNFQDEPSAKVDPANLLGAVGEARVDRIIPR